MIESLMLHAGARPLYLGLRVSALATVYVYTDNLSSFTDDGKRCLAHDIYLKKHLCNTSCRLEIMRQFLFVLLQFWDSSVTYATIPVGPRCGTFARTRWTWASRWSANRGSPLATKAKLVREVLRRISLYVAPPLAINIFKLIFLL